jgi:hypothetical protein
MDSIPLFVSQNVPAKNLSLFRSFFVVLDFIQVGIYGYVCGGFVEHPICVDDDDEKLLAFVAML